MKIGIDCGGVLFITNTKFESSEKEDTTQTEDWVPGAVAGLRILHEEGYELFVVSFCGKRRAAETRQKLLEVRDLIPPENVFIVKDKFKKGQVCREHRLEMLIDDRLDVLEAAGQHFPALRCVLFTSWESLCPDTSRNSCITRLARI
jgi:hypothetical protein